jgi:hypothetical protein
LLQDLGEKDTELMGLKVEKIEVENYAYLNMNFITTKALK